MATQTLEGTWEEIAAHIGEMAGKRLTVLVDTDAAPLNLEDVPAAGPPPEGGALLIFQANDICQGYPASRSADARSLALAEQLSQSYTTRRLTFDRDLPKQAAHNAPLVTVHLLP